MSDFGETAERLFGMVIANSLGACLVVCCVLLLQALFRNRFGARWHYLLWMLLLVRLAVPWTPASPLSLANAFPVNGPSRAVQPSAETYLHQPVSVVTSDSLSPSSPVFGGVADTDTGPADAPAWTWATVARVAWMIGVAVFVMRVLAASWCLRRWIHDATPVRNRRVLAVFERCKAQMRLKRNPRLLCSGTFRFPVVFGLMRPCLVLSQRSVDTLSDAELSHVFLHELGHVKRGDAWVAWITAVLQAVHWFNPLVWYGLRRMRQDRELACDALAVSVMVPAEAATYGETLVRLMEREISPMRLSGTVGLIGGESQLKRRIEMISQYNASPYRLTWGGLVLFTCSAAVLLTRAMAAEPVAGTAGDAPAPQVSAQGAKISHVIPFETYSEPWSKFAPGDGIEITELRGTSAVIEEGQTYQVKGRYTLKSRDVARLQLFCTNGETRCVQPSDVSTVKNGSGEFVRDFTITKRGQLHVSFYPAAGGEGFGGTYFREKTPSPNPGDGVDLAVDDASFTVLRTQDGQAGLLAAITNKGSKVSPPFEISFYRVTVKPKTGKDGADGAAASDGETQMDGVYLYLLTEDGKAEKATMHGGGSLKPGETWREACQLFALEPGENTYYVMIDPDNGIKEANRTNNQAKVTVKGKKVVKEVVEVE